MQQTQSCILCGEVPAGTGCNLEGRTMDSFIEQAAERIFDRGQVVFKENSVSTAAYSIKRGRIKLYRTDDHGTRQVISLLGPGDIIGFRSLLANEPNSMTAEAIEKTTVCMVPRQKLLDMFNITSDLALDMMAKLSAELRVSEEQMVSLLHHSVKQRTARLLLTLVDAADEADLSRPQRLVRLQRTEMAQILGTTPESLSRTLHTFAEEKFIESTRTSITLLDRTAIERLAGNNS